MVVDIKLIVDWIHKKIDPKENKNALITIVGPIGSGKSYGALELARQIAKKNKTHFSIKNNVGFTFVDVLKKTSMEGNVKRGTPFIFEEVGVTGGGGSSREALSAPNRRFSSFIQTCRSRNQIIIFTVPKLGMIDSQARDMLHWLLITHHIDFKEEVLIVKPFKPQYNHQNDKLYKKYPRVTIDGIKCKVKRMKIAKPPADMIAEYEIEKDIYQKKLYKEFVKEEEKNTHPRGAIDYDKAIELRKKGLTIRDISKFFNVTTDAVQKSFSRHKTDDAEGIAIEKPVLEAIQL